MIFIAALLPRRKREPAQHGGPSHVLLAPALGRPPTTAGKCFSFFYPRVQDANQPTRGIFHFNLSPIYPVGSVALGERTHHRAKGKAMSDTKRVTSDPKRDSTMSIAVGEAFEYLNAGTRKHYRGAGDTASAARDRAAREAGISPAQAERLWKRWRTMASVDGDVYRALRNQYERLCVRVENAADALERERREIEETNAAFESHPPMAEGMVRAAKGAPEQDMK